MAWAFLTGENVNDGWQFKTADHLCQEVAEVVANGGAVCVYALPLRSGHLVGWQHDLLAEVAQFCWARQAVAQGSSSVPQAVVLHSQTHYYAHNARNGPLYPLGQATQAMEGAVHALLDAGYHVDLQNEEGLLARLAEYPLVVVPEEDPLPEHITSALRAYVEAGGRLVLSGVHVASYPILADLAGVRAVGAPRAGFHYLPSATGTATVAGPWQLVKLAGAVQWLPLLAEPDPEKGTVGSAAVTGRDLGQGCVVAIHGPVFAAYYRTHYPQLRRVLRDLFQRVWPEPLSRIDAPRHVVETLRRKSGHLVVHLLNRSAGPAPSPRNVMIEHVPPVGPVTVTVRLAERPHAVRPVPEQADMPITWDWHDGLLTATLPQLATHPALVIDGVASGHGA